MSQQLASAGHIICRHGSHVLIIRRSIDLDTWPGFWWFPGGKIEDGEFLREWAIRETLEEVWVRIDPVDISHDIFVETRTVQWVKLYYFGVTEDFLNMPENIEPDKHTDMMWCDMDDLPFPFVPHHLAAIDCLKTKNMYIELDVAP